MCGIAGFFHSDQPASEVTLAAMLSASVHRGPNDQGRFISGGIALGMRWLSTIDLHPGLQQVSNEDGSIWEVFNGEIHKYQELRREVIANDPCFRMNSDTETLIHRYDVHPKFLQSILAGHDSALPRLKLWFQDWRQPGR